MSCHFQPFGALKARNPCLPFARYSWILDLPPCTPGPECHDSRSRSFDSVPVYPVRLHRSLPLFHPLARYPGPILCKISMFWLAKVAWGGKEHIYHQELHERYGDIIRIGMR